MSRVYYNRGIPSDGMTIDTDHGPVDTVALDRVRAGIRTRLNGAEHEALNATLLQFDREVETVLAAGLGLTPSGVNRRIVRARQKAALDATPPP